MKKFVSGLIVGALLFSGVSVFADSVSLIGQKVQGLFTIEKNGARVSDAVIINGSAYAPVRAIAEATGVDLTIEGKRIIMSDAITATSAPVAEELIMPEVIVAPTPVPTEDPQVTRSKITTEIARLTANIADLEANVIPMFEAQAKEMSTNGAVADTARKTADNYRKVVARQQAEIVALQTQLAELAE